MAAIAATTDGARAYLRALVERDLANSELLLRLAPEEGSETHVLALRRKRFAEGVLRGLA